MCSPQQISLELGVAALVGDAKLRDVRKPNRHFRVCSQRPRRRRRNIYIYTRAPHGCLPATMLRKGNIPQCHDVCLLLRKLYVYHSISQRTRSGHCQVVQGKGTAEGQFSVFVSICLTRTIYQLLFLAFICLARFFFHLFQPSTLKPRN